MDPTLTLLIFQVSRSKLSKLISHPHGNKPTFLLSGLPSPRLDSKAATRRPLRQYLLELKSIYPIDSLHHEKRGSVFPFSGLPAIAFLFFSWKL